MTSKMGRGGTRYAPYAFTEQGIAMLSSVLSSESAIKVNAQVLESQVGAPAPNHLFLVDFMRLSTPSPKPQRKYKK